MGQQPFMGDQAASRAVALDPVVIDDPVDRLSAVVAERVIEVMRAQELIAIEDDKGRWLDAQEVARRLGVSREWVYEHADELGATRLGSGPRPRLRFPSHGLGRSDSPPGAERKGPNSAPRRTQGLISIYNE